MSKAIQKKEALGTKTELAGDRTYTEEDVKRQLKENNLTPTEDIIVENPFTGKSTAITIDRTGTHESKLALILADKNTTREQKDVAISMYMFERGKENSSFLMDLFQHKGNQTKEVRAFKEMMRFDFDMFASTFVSHLEKRADRVLDTLGLFAPSKLYLQYAQYRREQTDILGYPPTFKEFCESEKIEAGVNRTDEWYALAEGSMLDFATAELLMGKMKKNIEQRLKEKGYGIYIDKGGRTHSIYEDNSTISDAVEEDVKIAAQELEKTKKKKNE